VKASPGKVRVGAVAALSVLVLAAMATIASPDRQVRQSVSGDSLARPLVTQRVDEGRLMMLASDTRTSAQSLEPQRPPVLPPPRRPLPIPLNLPAEPRPTVPSSASQLSAGAPAAVSGAWTPLNNQPSAFTPTFFPNGAFLLTDGRVLVQDAQLTDIGWWTLTPDNTGSYINGTWSQVASPPNCPNGYPDEGADTVYSPLYYASAVLPDGRFVMIGGEYNYNYSYGKGGDEVWTNQGAIYDPIANSWKCIAAPSGWTQIGDAQSVVLPNGTFMLAHFSDNQVATLNVNTDPPTFNSPFTPAGKSADPYNDEEGWTLLPDGTVLSLEIYNANDGTETPALVYTPSLRRWSNAGVAPNPLVLLKDGNTTYDEIGPAILRPDDTVFAVGATGFSDIFYVNTHSWASGPAFPTITDSYSAGGCNISGVSEQLVAADAPAALLPDGNVLVAASPVDSHSACGWIPPTEFFEFDGSSLTQVAEPTYGPNVPAYDGRLLVLPTGQVLYTNSYNYVELYTPAGTPEASWAPTITTSPAEVNPGGTDFQLTGKQFNGLSQAIGYGDDYQASTNYPLVRITNNATGHVFYARTHSHSTMAVATGSATVSTEFDVPASIELGSSTLVVVANGIPSQPVDVNVSTATPLPTPTPVPTPAPGGKISVSTGTVGFPNAGVGEAPAFANFIIQNLSPRLPLIGNVGTPTGPFSFNANTGGAFDLGPLGLRKIKLLFTPTGLGPATGALVVTSNDRALPLVTVNLKGTGLPGRLATNVATAPVFTSSPETLVFGKVKQGSSPKILRFKIENIGKGQLQGTVPSSLSLPFAVIHGGGSFDLAPGQTQKIAVAFEPTLKGHVSVPLTITVTSPSKPPAGITITLSGKGT